MKFRTALIAIGLFVPVAAAHAGADLARKQCGACHAVDANRMGPSFRQIAARFKGKPNAEADLRARLRSGQGHPEVKASDAELNSIIQWTLTL
jgi:cytochrome c